MEKSEAEVAITQMERIIRGIPTDSILDAFNRDWTNIERFGDYAINLRAYLSHNPDRDIIERVKGIPIAKFQKLARETGYKGEPTAAAAADATIKTCIHRLLTPLMQENNE